MSILQKIIYVYLNTIAKLAFKVYFRSVKIRGKKNIPHPCPTIITPNHPNTMVDPVLMASFAPGWMFFLANYGLFKKPITKFLMNDIFFSIPVQRPKDVEKGKAPNNLATIKRCCQVLEDKGTFFMGPEATSFAYRRIRPLKDGVARIALTAAKRGKFKSGIVIQPVGTNYSDPTRFRSEIIANIGQPILIDDYKDLYRKDKNAAIQSIMDNLRHQLQELTIHTQDEIEAQFLEWIEIMAKSERVYGSFEERLAFDKKVLPIIRILRTDDKQAFEKIWQKLYEYFQTIDSLSIEDIFVKKNKPVSTLEKGLVLLLSPILFFIKVINFPWLIPTAVYHKLKLYKSYRSMVELIIGTTIIPFLYFFIGIIIWQHFSWEWMLGYFSVSVFILLMLRPFLRWKKSIKMRTNLSTYSQLNSLVKQRETLVNLLNKSELLN